MNFAEFFKTIDVSSLEDNDDIMTIVDYCGLEAAKALVFSCSGVTLSIPLTIIARIKDSYILKHCKTTDIREIRRFANECGFTERYVKDLLKTRKGMIEGQMTIFDVLGNE